jgi:hypothetical protein
MRNQDKKDSYFSFCNIVFLLLGALLIASACGYHVRSSMGKLPSGIASIGIPTFRNLTNEYKIEQLFSRAVLKEFSQRTQIPVSSSSTNVDAVLMGEIRGIGSVPVAFGTQTAGSQTFGTAFIISVTASVKLMRVKDAKVLWQNDNIFFRDRFVLNANARDFFFEENPALERLAQSFAASIAGAILDRTSP